MRVFTKGAWHGLPVKDCTGYVAEGIELDEKDITRLASMSDRELMGTVRQLAGRIKSNRIGTTKAEPISDATARIINEYRKGCTHGPAGACAECAHGALQALASRHGLAKLPDYEPEDKPRSTFGDMMESLFKHESRGFHTGGFVRGDGHLKPGEIPVVLSTPLRPGEDWMEGYFKSSRPENEVKVHIGGTCTGRWSSKMPRRSQEPRDVPFTEVPKLAGADFADIEKRVMAQLSDAFFVPARRMGKTESLRRLERDTRKLTEAILDGFLEKLVGSTVQQLRDEEGNGATWGAIENELRE